MKKLLIIGIKGMAGHVIYNYLKNRETLEVFGVARNIAETDKEFSLDVSDTKRLAEIIRLNSFDYVVNCIGVLNKDAEDHPSKAIWYNSYFPHFLEETTRETSTKVIHISTDCVFNGKKGNYSETDVKDGFGFYAQSKALGEIDNEKDLTIRTSIIGPELNKNGIGLFHWFMNQTGDINGYTSAIWSGVTTLELAKAIENVVEKPLVGLVHLTNGQPINKYDLLSIFKEIWNRDVNINAFEGKDVDKSLLKSTRFDYNVPSYQQMLEEQSEWMVKFSNLYSY